MTNLKYIDLFAGMGGFRAGFDAAGLECVFTSELETNQQEMYKSLHGDKSIFGDITKISVNDIPEHDIMIGGLPCQPFSHNGNRTGFKHTDGNLFHEIERIARDKRPEFVVIENVMGLMTMQKGATLGFMLNSLAQLDYKVSFDLINAEEFGLPQARKRIFIIGSKSAEEEKWEDSLVASVNTAKKRVLELYPKIKTFNFDFEHLDTQGELKDYIVGDGKEFLVDGNFLRHMKGDIFRIKDGTKKGYTEFTAIKDYTTIDIAFPTSKTRRGRVKQNKVKTLDTSTAVAIYKGKGKWLELSLHEQALLQGFTTKQFNKIKNLPKTSLREAIGNSVPIPVIKVLAERIKVLHKKLV